MGTDQISMGLIPRIQRITRHYISAISPGNRSNLSEATREEYIREYNNLSFAIEQFLNVPLEYDDDLQPTLYGKRIGLANLSQGQSILLQLCLAIYTQGARLDKCILLIDEPENHLYPKALVDALDKIIDTIGDGQIFITTHSVHVLGHFDPSCIWYIENGLIRDAGNVPNTVLTGLLGDEKEKARLTSFLSLPETMAFNQFSISREEAIISLREEALAQIKSIRQQKDISFQTGRLHAFWTQQLANATLVIQELGDPVHL